MASCCSAKTTPTKEAFLKEKAHNFRAFLLSYKPNDEVMEFINGFDEGSIVSVVLTKLVPMKALGATEQSVVELMGKLSIPPGEMEAVKTKLLRYIEMFVTIVTTS